MKRALLFMACVLASLTMSAQEDPNDYRPFVEDGKVWHVDYSITNSSHYSDQYILTNNEVVKNGKTYISMSWNSNNEAEIYDAVLLREENHKVYIFDENKQEERLIFDYSLKAGDTFEAFSYDVRKMMSYKVLSVGDYTEGPLITRYDYDENGDSVIEHQRYLRKWTVCRVGDESYQKTWIEGVGSLEGPLGNISEYSPNPRYLAYVENYSDESYLPFSFHDELGQVHGCNLPTGKTTNREDNIDRLTYELEGDRLHVYGEIFTNCGPNHYIYFFEEPTDDPLVHKLRYRTIDLAPHATCAFLHATDFYVSGFDPNLSYIVVDNQGVEHPVINKTPQMAYRSFVEDGKVWKVGGKDSGNPVKFVTYYYFDGDTIIGGKTCKQMMCQRYLSPDCPHSSYYDFWAQLPSLSKVGAWYEEDKKVYVCMEGTQGMQMLYDFSLEANDTLILNDYQPYYTVRPKQTGGIKVFKGVYRDIMLCGQDIYITTWLEGVGGIDGPLRNVYPENESNPQFLMSCTVGDEVIYMNDEYEDGATPEGARKDRIDFTHTIKIKPKAPKVKAPRRIEAMSSLYGEYNDQQLGINLNSLDDAYQVSITDEAGKALYEKTVDAGTIVGLNIDISTYAKGRYTVTVENSREVFTGIFETLTTGIETVRNKAAAVKGTIYDLQGRRVDSPSRRGVYIKDGRKIIR